MSRIITSVTELNAKFKNGQVGFQFNMNELRNKIFKMATETVLSDLIKLGMTVSINMEMNNDKWQPFLEFCRLDFVKSSKSVLLEKVDEVINFQLIHISGNGQFEGLNIDIDADGNDYKDALKNGMRTCLFRKHQIDFIGNISSEIVISGTRSFFGYYPYINNQRNQSMIESNTEYFTLQLSGNENHESTLDVPSLVLPSIEIGAPCPPIWYNHF